MSGLNRAYKRRPNGYVRDFSPALWLDAADPSTMYQSNGGALASANNDPVGYWLDKGPNGFHASQATSTKRPILQTNSQNTRSGILSDGVDDYLQTALNQNGVATTTWFMVANPTAGTGATVSNYNTNGGLLTYLTSTTAGMDGRPHGGTYYSASQTFAATISTALVVSYWDGTNMGSKKNNSSFTTTIPAFSGNIITSTNLALFGYPPLSAYRSGIIYEVIILNYLATADQIQNISNYLNSKWSIY